MNRSTRNCHPSAEPAAAYSRTLAAWIKTDKAGLLKGLVAGQSVFEICASLDRSVSGVVSQVAAMVVTGELAPVLGEVEFPQEAVGDFMHEAALLAVTGTPLVEAARWAAGAEMRAPRHALLASAPWPAAEQGAQLALDMGLWAVLDASPADLVWLASRPVEQLLSPLESVLTRLEAATPAMVRKAAEGGLADLDGPVVFPRCAPTTGSATSAGRASWSKARAGAAPGRRLKRGKARFGSRGRSQSYPSGSPVRDTRSAAEKAWESKTHW